MALLNEVEMKNFSNFRNDVKRTRNIYFHFFGTNFSKNLKK